MGTKMSMDPGQYGRGAVHGKASCWAARTVAVGIGLVVASVAMRSDDDLEALVLLVPFVLAGIAWRWHLLGGAALILATGVLFLFLFFLRPPSGDYAFYSLVVFFTLGMVILGGGFLHLLAWWMERRR